MTDNKGLENEYADVVPVVAIGASAGGLEQIKLLLEHMPTDTGAAFVVIQHLDPTHESHLTELLGQAGELPVVTINEHMALVADQVHVLPPAYRLGMEDERVLKLTPSEVREAKPTLIDAFFRDLAHTLGRRAVGIVLSGTGSDGALGLKAIRSAGGLAMAQNPDNADFDGMPRAAAKHASPDCLLDTQDMVEPLCNHLRLNLSQDDSSVDTNGNEVVSDEVLDKALETLRVHDKYDFRHHKPNMLKRRLHRRMTLGGISSAQVYLQMLENDSDERTHLCGDFLISVTDFFREPDSYTKLDEVVIRKLLNNRSIDNPVRVWVPGCATGEEAYSIAMLLAEAIEANGRNHEFIVFATDIDETALARARAGLYPESIETDLSGERLRAFFDKVDEHYQIKRSLRERVVFAPQSVTGDPPYSHLDLISCRNLLIYLNAETQKHLIKLFHFALNDTGFLFLGSSETVGRQVDLFEPVSKTHRLYRRLATNRQYRLEYPAPHGARDEVQTGHGPALRTSYSRPQNAEQIARDILLAEHVPASVLINRKLEILCSYGPTRDYLSLPLGESSLGLLDMVLDEYRSHLRAVTHRAFRYDEQSDITTKFKNGSQQSLMITARPLKRPEQARGLVLITFEPVRDGSHAQPGTDSDNDLQRELAEELDSTRNELHGTIAALEESNEDLKGSNEEIMSMNEELQSTNEELETSKEELQSVNEELTTVNTELENKVAELESAHNDLSNLFAGTQVATLFLNRSLCIKRFTPAIRDLLNLISSDIGRPLRDMTLKFSDPNLLGDADKVLDELTPRETEVRAASGRWYQRRIVPYRTNDNVIKGVVIIFADVTEIRNAMLGAQENEARLDLAVSALMGGTWEMPVNPTTPDKLSDNIYLSSRLKNLLGFSDEQMPNSLQAWVGRIVPEDRARFSDIEHRRQSDNSAPLHYRIRHSDGSIRWFASYGKLVIDADKRTSRWLGIDCDISEFKQTELRARHTQSQLQVLADAMPELIAFLDPDKVIRFANTVFNERFNNGADGPIGRNLVDVLGEQAVAMLKTCSETALKGTAVSGHVNLPATAQGEQKGEPGFHAHHVPLIIDAKVLGYYLIMTPRAGDPRDADAMVSQQRLTYIQRLATFGEMASTLGHDLKQPLSAINGYVGGLTRMLHAEEPATRTVPVAHKISEQIARASEVIDNVRAFVGRHETSYAPVDLNDLVQSALSLLRDQAYGMSVSMDYTNRTPLPKVHGDAVQLRQVLVNLIGNAMDALQDNDRDQRKIWLTTTVPDAAHVQITIEDSGPGLSPSKLETVFDAFQTTKLNGMGMGLAISRSIAEWHGGRLWAESEPGHGAQFYLSLPVDQTQADE